MLTVEDPSPEVLEAEALHGVHFALGAGRAQFQGQEQLGAAQPLGARARRLRKVSGDEGSGAHAATK